MRALIVPADLRTPAEVRDQEWSLPELQAAVGGDIESVYPHEPNIPCGHWTAFVNESGLLIPLPYNNRGTTLTRMAGAYDSQLLYGDLVMFGPDTDEGDCTDVTAAMLTLAAELFLVVEP